MNNMKNMENTDARNDRMDELLRRVGASDVTGNQLKKAAASNPAVASAVERLTDSDIQKISALLSNPQALQKLLSTPQAQMLSARIRPLNKE